MEARMHGLKVIVMKVWTISLLLFFCMAGAAYAATGISGQVTSAGGQPLVGITIEVFGVSAGSTNFTYGYSYAEGRYTFNDLKPGSYRVLADPYGLTVPEGFSLSGRRVNAWPVNGEGNYYDYCGSNGSYIIQGLPAGSYIVAPERGWTDPGDLVPPCIITTRQPGGLPTPSPYLLETRYPMWVSNSWWEAGSAVG